MNEFDAMRLLAEANPVDAGDLAPLERPVSSVRRVSTHRLELAIGLAAVIAAALAGVSAFSGSNSSHRHRSGIYGMSPRVSGPTGANGLQGPSGANGPTGGFGSLCGLCDGPTGARGPTGVSGAPDATGGTDPTPPVDPTTAFYEAGPTGNTGPTISVADASDALGADVVLPDVPPIDPSDGKITEDCAPWFKDKRCAVAVAFPAQRVWIYDQPSTHWSGSSDPLVAYQNSVKYEPRDRIVYLSGTPALIGPDGDTIQFLLGGVHTRIWVAEPAASDTPNVRAIAQSIVDLSK